MRVLGALAAVIILLAVALPALAGNDKVYVCHAAGRDGTTKYVTLYVPATDTGFPQGHFTEEGTQAAGHESDYLGQCAEDNEPTPTPVAEPSPTPEPSSEPTPKPKPKPTPKVTPPPTDTEG